MPPPSHLDLNYRSEDSYQRSEGRVLLTGTQALVRLMIEQASADRGAGINTAGFVSGYRGSPLGAVDIEMWKAEQPLTAAGIRFQPAINEDLAATAILGTQKVGTDPERTVDGVFSLWYGKGPGVDRSGDAMRHANAYGSSEKGGVLVVAGDDHGCASSLMSHQSDFTMAGWSMPVLHPSCVADYIPFGLYGFALSRFSGAWTGFKAISEVVESAATVELAPRREFVIPQMELPVGGLHYRWPDLPGTHLEQRLAHKLNAVRAFAAANPIDLVSIAPREPRLVILAVGKAYGDVMEALRVCGVDAAQLQQAGVAIGRIGLVFPLDLAFLRRAVTAARTVLVVEEKAAFVESQVKDALFNWPERERPGVLGKTDLSGNPCVPADRELRPSIVAPLLARQLAPLGLKLELPAAWIEEAQIPTHGYVRTPYFCSGCPHSTSTRIPEGSQAFAGTGCHTMVNWMDRQTAGLVQMGAEGADLVGQEPFTRRPHVFQNMGEGTFFHSGYLAIRQAIAAGLTVTYKILFNDAVAMTGGQPVDGILGVAQITRLVDAEGAKRIEVVTDEPHKYRGMDGFARGIGIHHRDDLDRIQRELRETPGVTILIYDQTCAAEKRRRRKRGEFPAADRRVVINELVCEGCGDCQTKSNCLSVVPIETEFGRKRAIDQSSCNTDFSCVKGFCPSFVTVEGGKPKRTRTASIDEITVLERAATIPEPSTAISGPFDIVVCGVGGTGVVTVAALIATAAHIDGNACSELDFTGFAQKGGPVVSFLRLAARGQDLNQVRVDRGQADAMIAADLVVASSRDVLATLASDKSRIVANARENQTGSMLRDPNARIDTSMLENLLRQRVGVGAFFSIDAHLMAERLVGDPQFGNVLLLGVAWQQGLIPVSLPALDRAFEVHGVAVATNRHAFLWGRLIAADRPFVEACAGPAQIPTRQTLDVLIQRREAFLVNYQDEAYAREFRSFVDKVLACEAEALGPGNTSITEAVCLNLFKLMAYKDEYEVARLYTQTDFIKGLQDRFEGRFRLKFHLAPPGIARTRTGASEPSKLTLGAWILPVFRALAPLKRLRGTRFDMFGYTADRKLERRLIEEYRDSMNDVLRRLAPDTKGTILALATLPETIRGYGHVKHLSAVTAARRQHELVADLARLRDLHVVA